MLISIYININNKESRTDFLAVGYILCLIYLRLRHLDNMGTMEFHYISTKIKPLHRNHWMASVQLAFHIIARQMTTSQCFDYIADPETYINIAIGYTIPMMWDR